MISCILYLCLLAILVTAPLKLYRSSGPRMCRFYARMLALVSARKLYRLVVFILLLLFHYLHLRVHTADQGVLLSTPVMFTFFGLMNAEKWLFRLHDHRKVATAVAFTVLVMAFVPVLYTQAVTLAVLLLAAMLHPSQAAVILAKDKDMQEMFTNDRKTLSTVYY